MRGLRPPHRLEGYLPLADHGLIGDGRGSALVGRDGLIAFMCVPHFHDPPLCCALLDRRRGGGLLLAPEGLRESGQSYLEDTGVLVTTMAAADGTVEVTDAFALRADARLERSERAARCELVRSARVVSGTVTLRVGVWPRGGAVAERAAGGLRLRCAGQGLTLHLRSSHPLHGTDRGPEGRVRLREGEEFWLTLSWDEGEGEGDSHGESPAGTRGASPARECIGGTAGAWRRWAARLPREMPHGAMVRRSAVTLKLLEHVENGGIVAAPTSSLPEYVGGTRNWDYRYVWMRDATYAVFALRRIGLPDEAERFLSWVLATVRRGHGPRVLYEVTGGVPGSETVDEELAGYRGSAPVRWGNAAADQTQHDIYGEIVDCAYHWAGAGGRISGGLWEALTAMTELARTTWDSPDRGIWEVRSKGLPATHSAAMCQVALDRSARLVRRLGLPGDAECWAREAGRVSERLGPGGGLDASVLALPLRRVIPADHPRMVATTRAVAERLDAGRGLIYRNLPAHDPEAAGGITEPEGAFALCGFWLVDNLAGQGRVDEAEELFERLCSYASPLGLLSEEIDPADGSLLGNFPQGLSHVGLISSAVTLARARTGRRPELLTLADDAARARA